MRGVAGLVGRLTLPPLLHPLRPLPLLHLLPPLLPPLRPLPLLHLLPPLLHPPPHLPPLPLDHPRPLPGPLPPLPLRLRRDRRWRSFASLGHFQSPLPVSFGPS